MRRLWDRQNSWNQVPITVPSPGIYVPGQKSHGISVQLPIPGMKSFLESFSVEKVWAINPEAKNPGTVSEISVPVPTIQVTMSVLVNVDDLKLCNRQ